MTRPILAHPSYVPPSAPPEYDAMWMRTQLAGIARALSPTSGRSVVAATTIQATDRVLACDATAGAFAVTLLPANQVQFLLQTILKTDASVHAVTITGTVSGVVNPTLATQYKSLTLFSDGISWYSLAST